MHRNHNHGRPLETYTVEPGSETGLYYILVANLAHGTTRWELKAFASQACEVDHAEVYPPTSGFVRVKGRANFEKALKYLDGNTLEYRALQADGRNLNQPTVVKLPPDDYHAMKIRQRGRLKSFDEPNASAPDPNAQPEPFPQGAYAGVGSPYSEYQASVTSTLSSASQADTQWGYVMASSYVPGDDYQPATPTTVLMSPGPMMYQALAPTDHGFIQPVATSPLTASPPAAVYQTITSPLFVGATQYDASASYFSPPSTYDVEGQGYAGYYTRTGEGNAYPYSTGYVPWLPDTAQPPQADQLATTTATASSIPTRANERPDIANPPEQRKIVIHNLDRETVSEAVVMAHLVQLAGIGTTPGQVERVDLSVNSSGRPRAFVTFSAADLAAAAVGALDGRVVGGRKLAARVIGEGAGAPGGSGGRHGHGHGHSHGYGHGRRVQIKPASTAGAVGSRTDGGGGGRLARASQSQGQSRPRGGGLSVSSPVAGSGLSLGSGSGSVSASGSKGSAEQKNSKKEERPVIVDGSVGGRWKREKAPVVVDGSRAGGRGNGSR